jgi:HSP20 family molecular chaperone IbpA
MGLRILHRLSKDVLEKIMSRNPFANHPFLLGFEEIERLVERAAKSASDGYPPYNIEQRGDCTYRISLAVAGFSETDLSVTLEDGQLVIRGGKPEQSQREYLHRGIAARQFQRSFVLAEGMEVSGATLENGLLHVDLVREEQPAVVKTIPISNGPS